MRGAQNLPNLIDSHRQYSLFFSIQPNPSPRAGRTADGWQGDMIDAHRPIVRIAAPVSNPSREEEKMMALWLS